MARSEPNTNDPLKKAFRIILIRNGLNHQQVAERLGVSKQQVSRWVSSNSGCAYWVIAMWAESFGIKPSELLALGE